jgi:hypothetical protein
VERDAARIPQDAFRRQRAGFRRVPGPGGRRLQEWAWKFSPPPDSRRCSRSSPSTWCLAGDNAIVIGLAAAGLPAANSARRRSSSASSRRPCCASASPLITQQLSADRADPADSPAACLLLWVCWKMWRELRPHMRRKKTAPKALSDADSMPTASRRGRRAAQDLCPGRLADRHRRRFDVAGQRAGGRRRGADHPTVLVIGLALSIALMGIAASFIARCCKATAGSPMSACRHPLRGARDDLSRRGWSSFPSSAAGSARLEPWGIDGLIRRRSAA